MYLSFHPVPIHRALLTYLFSAHAVARYISVFTRSVINNGLHHPAHLFGSVLADDLPYHVGLCFETVFPFSSVISETT